MNRYLGCLFILLFSWHGSFMLFAQNELVNDSSAVVLSQKKVKKKTKSTDEKRDSSLYVGIKQKMYRSKVGKSIYQVFFRDVYNSNANSQVAKIEMNPFLPFEGKVIASIRVMRLNVFGASVYDTTRFAKNTFQKIGNKLHTSTKEKVIKNSFLTFKVGDLLDAEQFINNERLLRQQKFLIDARIYVQEIAGKPGMVDIVVVTQDTWTLMPALEYSNKDKFGVILTQSNYRGKAHEVQLGYRKDNNNPFLNNNVFGSYTIPYIKKSLITAQTNLNYTGFEKSANVKLYRPFLTPDIKYAGAAELGYFARNLQDRLRGVDSTIYFPVHNFLSDMWLGRAFPVFFGDEQLKRQSRIIVAARGRKFNYTKRPELTADSNQTYQDRRNILVSLGFSNRTYQRDVLVYGFGRTEDVPIGYLASVVGGAETAELGFRHYFGIKIAKGRFLPKESGYLYTLLNFGSYLKKGRTEQGVFGIEGYYYSPLINSNLSKIRQFVNFNYTNGLNRFNTVEERFNISNEGIRGVNSDSLRGVKKMVVNLETVIFSRASIAGFRLAPYLFFDGGLVSFANKNLFSSPIYTGFGIGCRFRNENLAFNTFQIRLGIYPNIPNVDTFKFAFGGEQVLRLKDFDISAPEEVRFK